MTPSGPPAGDDASDGPAPGRVLRIAGGSYEVEIDGGTVDCILGGRLKQGGTEQVAVGDRVRIEPGDDGPGRIAEILPRRSKLARKSPTGEKEQTIAANIHQVAAVFSIARPEPDLRMLDRLLVLSELNGLDAFVVVNKTDLSGRDGEGGGDGEDDEPRGPGEARRGGGARAGEGDDGDGGRREGRGAADDHGAAGGPEALPDELAVYRDLGYDVLPTSATEGRGLEPLRERIAGSVTVLAGPSGAGKSSLLNAVLPDLDRRVGEVSARAGRGRHTTVNATLVPLPGGGYVADTPGLQYLALWRLPPDELAAAFPEFRPFLGTCKFNDCRHLQEPGCGVRTALERGEIPESRWRSYAALLEEAENQRRPWE